MAKTAIDYDLLAIFVAVADATSFSKAAHALGIAKGTVSRAIASLEDQVGAELIHRTTHRVALSTAGTSLYERTAAHLRALDDALGKLPERREQPSGLLRLTAPNELAQSVLPDVMAQFALRFPEVSFDLRITNATLDLVAEGFDLAIRGGTGRLKDSALTVRRLGGMSGGFYAAPSYLARRGSPKSPSATDHDWLLHPRLVDLWKVPREHARFVCDDYAVLRELARTGAGIAFMPDYFASAYVRAGHIEAVAVPGRTASGQLVMLYPSSGPVPRKVTAFRDFLLEWLAKSPLD